MADVLKPDLLWIEGRCYRVNDPSSDTSSFQENDLYESEMTYEDAEEDSDDEDIEVSVLENGRYCTYLHVSKHYLGSVIGKKGMVKRRVELDTRTEIKIPKPGQTGDVTILGPSEANVKAARRRINMIVMTSRFKQRSTHFISIPMNTSEIVDSFNQFKHEILCENTDRGIEESLFIKPTKLHLTLGVMCLMDNEERLAASKLLTEVRENIILPILQDYNPLRIRLKGVSYMNDDPREVDVLFGKVEEDNAPPGILQRIADETVEYFARAGFMQREHEREQVKLHLTLINSKYRKHSNENVNCEQTKYQLNKRETFDGSYILEKYVDFDFGVAELTNIHLSQRHSMGNDGYYQPTCVICCTNSGEI